MRGFFVSVPSIPNLIAKGLVVARIFGLAIQVL